MASQMSQDAAMRVLKSWRFPAITKAALELVFCGCLLSKMARNRNNFHIGWVKK